MAPAQGSIRKAINMASRKFVKHSIFLEIKNYL